MFLELIKLGELCYDNFLSNNLSQMVNFPTWIQDFDSYGPTYLGLFLPSDPSIYCIVVISPLGNSGNVAVSFSIYFP